MRRFIINFLFLSACFAFACGEIESPPENDINVVLMRIKNVSSVTYDSVEVSSSGITNEYGDILPGEVTEYFRFERLYSYAHINMTIDGIQFTIQPIDFIGETPLENGKYTYQISENGSLGQYDRLNITLVKDE